jgi:hypothetical protein
MNQRNNFSIALVILSLFAFGACAGEFDSTSDDSQEEVVSSDASPLNSGNAALVTTSLYQSAAELVNPERGYYVGYNLLSPSGAATVR